MLHNESTSRSRIPLEDASVNLNSARAKQDNETVKKSTAEYFSQLDQDLVRKLYLVFRLDFELFGYSPEPFLKI